jgi:hypothetical protein
VVMERRTEIRAMRDIKTSRREVHNLGGCLPLVCSSV